MLCEPSIRRFHYPMQLRSLLIGGALLGLALSTGCKSVPGTSAYQQSQFENEQLLSEFRAQKRRADELQIRNEQLAQRLDESERRLAQTQGNTPSSRVSSNDFGRTPLRSNTLGNQKPVSVDPRLLPPGSSTNAPGVLENSNGSLKWRPSRKKIQ